MNKLILWILVHVTLVCGKLNTNNNENYKDSFDPDTFLSPAQLIRRHGYPAETHTIQTEDGYLLSIDRIPSSRNGNKGGTPVVFQHGLDGSSADFLLNGNNSLAFLLADEGYDVWLSNCRGNTYSRAHVALAPEDPMFWNWSWHEVGLFDLPAVLHHINTTTGKGGDIVYIGHSMGTTEYFVMSSINSEAAKNVKLMIALAPVANMAHVRSPMRDLAQSVDELHSSNILLSLDEFLPHWKVFDILAKECSKDFLRTLCETAYFAFWGWNKDTFNRDIVPLTMGHAPSGSSTKSLLHYLQVLKYGGNFQQYDYGADGNLLKYNSTSPPTYNLQAIKTPIYLMYSDGDRFATSVDVERCAKNLPNLKGLYKVPNKSFDHIDFIWGKDAYNLVYKPILQILKDSFSS